MKRNYHAMRAAIFSSPSIVDGKWRAEKKERNSALVHLKQHRFFAAPCRCQKSTFDSSTDVRLILEIVRMHLVCEYVICISGIMFGSCIQINNRARWKCCVHLCSSAKTAKSKIRFQIESIHSFIFRIRDCEWIVSNSNMLSINFPELSFPIHFGPKIATHNIGLFRLIKWWFSLWSDRRRRGFWSNIEIRSGFQFESRIDANFGINANK